MEYFYGNSCAQEGQQRRDYREQDSAKRFAKREEAAGREKYAEVKNLLVDERLKIYSPIMCFAR